MAERPNALLTEFQRAVAALREHDRPHAEMIKWDINQAEPFDKPPAGADAVGGIHRAESGSLRRAYRLSRGDWPPAYELTGWDLNTLADIWIPTQGECTIARGESKLYVEDAVHRGELHFTLTSGEGSSSQPYKTSHHSVSVSVALGHAINLLADFLARL